VQDAERTQDFDEAARVHARIRRNLTRLGYRPIDLPKGTVAERVAFVLDLALR